MHSSFRKGIQPLISHSWSCGPRQSPGISSWTFWTPPFQWWAFHRMWRTRPILQAAARLWSEQSMKDKNVYYVTDHTTIHRPPLCCNRKTVDFMAEFLNHSHAVFWSGVPSHLCLQSDRLHAAKVPIAWIHSSSCRGWTWEPAPCEDLEYFCSASYNPTEQWSAESFLDPMRWSRDTPSFKLPEWKQNDLSMKYQPSHLPGCHWYHSHIKKSASWDHGPGNLSFFLFWHLEGKSSANDHVFN